MLETAFISNKTKKEIFKYSFLTVFAITAWILQIAVFSRFLLFDTSPNLIYLGSIFAGIIGGPIAGSFFGIISSFLCASTLFDHIFYLSYPIIGLTAGILSKSYIADELLLFLLSSITLIFGFELINGLQYSSVNRISILDRYILTSLSGAVIYVIIAPIFYFFMKFITKNLNLR